VTGTENGVTTVAQFDDGAPFLLERKLGEGLVYAFTVSLDTHSTDFVLRASFAPFLYELIAHATRETQARRRYAVGDGIPAPLVRGVHSVYAPDGKQRAIDEISSFSLPGAYRLKSESGETIVAVNIDPMESDLSRLNRSEIEGIRQLRVVGEAGAEGAGPGAGVDITLPPDEGTKFWRYFLISALALLAFESILASRTIR